MRPKGMKKLAMPVFALTTAAMIGGCAAQSGSTASSPATTAPAPTAPATSAAPTSESGGPVSTAPSVSAPASAPAATTATGATGPAPAPALVPTGATSAKLVYVGPTSAKPLHATKTVTGATYQRLLADLKALHSGAGVAQCMVLTGESASVTVTGGGHTAVFTIPGSPCRGVTVTEDGGRTQRLTSTMTLVNQVRAIAGFNGMAHPLTG